MFRTVIVMAPAESSEQIANGLLLCNPSLEILHIFSLEKLRALAPDVLARSRLIAFTSPIVVPPDILGAIGFGAYNFHPAPPTYPGLAPALFAIYRGARIYGGTAHVMEPRVDSGAIVGVELCLIADGATVYDIEMQAFAALVKIFKTHMQHLATDPGPLPVLPVKWSTDKSSRATLTAICDIPPDIDRRELALRVRAFANNHLGVQPTITLHGHTFRLVHEPGPSQPIPQQGAAPISEADVGHRTVPTPVMAVAAASAIQDAALTP